jgi:hypothetical protein
VSLILKEGWLLAWPQQVGDSTRTWWDVLFVLGEGRLREQISSLVGTLQGNWYWTSDWVGLDDIGQRVRQWGIQSDTVGGRAGVRRLGIAMGLDEMGWSREMGQR